MNTQQLIENLKKIEYTATLRKLTEEEINTIKITGHRLKSYMTSIKIYPR